MLSKPTLYRLHRWAALTFALPLLVVIATGLVLAVEPLLKARVPSGTVTLPRLEAIITAAGPSAGSASLFVRAYDSTVTVGGRGGSQTFELATSAPTAPGSLAGVFLTARRLHETLLLDLGWLVTASTIALIVLAAFGLLLGLPRLRNTLGGWHRLTGWVLLPLLIGSPLTGLALAFGVTFTAPTPRAPGSMPLTETLRAVAMRHDIGGLDFVRTVGGGAWLVRLLDETGTAVTYQAATDGLVAIVTNWPRVLHEGNWGGVLGGVANLVAGLGLGGLLGTGIYLWASRTLQRRRRQRQRQPARPCAPQSR